MKVKAGNWYTYNPTPLDLVDARTDLKPGDRVQVRNLPGCPPANTMRHAHVFDTAGNFRGLVCTGSLENGSYQNV